MSLARTALRLAGILALAQNPVIAKLCEGRIYDSRIEPFDAHEPVPVITVLTEEMQGEAYSANNGGAPFDDRCDLVIEIAMTAVTSVPDPQQPAVMLDLYAPVATAREMEAVLDLLEHTAVDALTTDDAPASLLLRRAVVRRASARRSARFVDADSGAKLAVRQVCLTVHLKGDDQRDVRDEGGAAYPGAPWQQFQDFPNLPDPLRTVCQAMPDGSSAQLVCKLLNGYAEKDPADLLNGVDATYAPQQTLNPGAAPIPPMQPGSSPSFVRQINIP